MKVRKGFVSNSSSTSFIIDAKVYTCADVALDMANTYFRENEYGEIDEEKYDLIAKNLERLDNKNTSIHMDCYDDIKISKKGNKIYVDATRNLEWNLDCIGWGGECEYNELMENDKWYFPLFGNELLGKSVNWEKKYNYKNTSNWSCNKCRTTNIEIDSGEIMCPKCGTDPDGKLVKALSRELKLKRVLKDEN